MYENTTDKIESDSHQILCSFKVMLRLVDELSGLCVRPKYLPSHQILYSFKVMLRLVDEQSGLSARPKYLPVQFYALLQVRSPIRFSTPLRVGYVRGLSTCPSSSMRSSRCAVPSDSLLLQDDAETPRRTKQVTCAIYDRSCSPVIYPVCSKIVFTVLALTAVLIFPTVFLNTNIKCSRALMNGSSSLEAISIHVQQNKWR
ncbi:hypothetical protein J6590_049268 [Homalodisca vitripennis]|nr:hypothetical protein J6590_049268 [Homalodisca vitripennis]